MKSTIRPTIAAAILALGLSACGRKADVQSSVTELEKAFPTAATPAPATAQPSAPAAAASPDALVKNAVAAARANDLAGGVIALQAAQARPGITAEQVMAVQRAKQSMVADLQQRAANGDPQALAQLKAIERTRSQ